MSMKRSIAMDLKYPRAWKTFWMNPMKDDNLKLK